MSADRSTRSDTVSTGRLVEQHGYAAGGELAEPELYVTRVELAAIMGVSVTTVDRLVQAGMPSETWGLRARRFRPSRAVAWARGRAEE